MWKDVEPNERMNGTAEDLELFELLEQAADTSGCSNVSMLLQYIASNPSAAHNFKTPNISREVSPLKHFPTEPSMPICHEEKEPSLSSRDHKGDYDEDKAANEPSWPHVTSERNRLTDDYEEGTSRSPEVERKIASKAEVRPQHLFADESCFDDTIANTSYNSEQLDRNVQDSNDYDHFGNDVQDKNQDEAFSVPSKSDNPIDFIGSISTCESLLAGSIVPVRSSTPPLRKLASKSQ